MPAFAWDNIENSLNQKNNNKKWFLYAAAASLMLIGGTTFWMSQHSNSIPTNTNNVAKALNSTSNNNNLNERNIAAKTENSSPQTDNRSVELNGSDFKANVNNPKLDPSQNKAEISSSILNNSTSLILSKRENKVEDTQVPQQMELIESGFSNFDYSFSAGELKNTPSSFGDFLQLHVSALHPQKPLQHRLSSWAFEVGYDQNQTAVNYQIASERNLYVHKNYLNHIKNGEFALSAPQFHTALRCQISPRFVVSVGLGYAQTRTSQNFKFRDSIPVSIAQGNEADAYGNYPIFGYSHLGQEIDYTGISTINMISVPVSLIHEYPLSRRWALTTELSARYNYISAAVGKTLNYHDLTLLSLSDNVYRNSVWSGRIGMGVQRRLTTKQTLGLRLNTQGAFTPLNKSNASVENRGWSVGLSAFYFWKLY